MYEIADISKIEFKSKWAINNVVEIVDGKKKCSACKEWKLLSRFCKNTNAKYGLNSSCKSCRRRRFFVYNFKESRRIKIKCMIGYGGCCQCCGENRIELLSIEHIRNKGHNLIYDQTIKLMRKLIELGFPEGYTCLCYNCNLSTKHTSVQVPCIHSKEYKDFYNKNIKPYDGNYGNQKELDELERKWNTMNGTGE